MDCWRFVKASFGIIWSLWLAGSQVSPSVEKVLLRILDEMGLQIEQCVLQHRGRIVKPMARDEVEQFVKKMGQSLKFTHIKKETNIDGIRYLSKAQYSRNLMIYFRVINDEPDQYWVQPYVSLEIVADGNASLEWIQAKNNLENILEKQGLIPHFYYSIQASKPISSSHPGEFTFQVLKRLRAHQVEAMRTKQTISISAYSAWIPDRLETKGGWMNVQVATRINKERKRLMFTLGTPIITIEY
ncbi:YwmB family TATA-box binding protein [Thermoflavimicrobium dichotomicum]|uniref:TATA-box binding n=1 Tax=Thermoflavimicrobium dichotomicum TaxID=46223 RepID=A0A1I3K0U7_9BACL|nr:YwmB family TATA-box binding protein [Thermoflavimicrobium dichotomicum]SFI66044.1 TATA-box binding [Thermoflavimicrobium dichotomicum]